MTELTGQIGLRRHGTTFITRAIEWCTYSHTHHVIVAISETQCISAEPGGVKLFDISSYPSLDWSRFNLTDTQRDSIVGAALKSQRLPYNYAVYPVLLAHRIFRAKVPNWLSGWLSRRPNVDCSQLVDDVYNKAGINLFTSANVLTTPGDFERYFVEHGWLQSETVKETV